MPPQSSINYTSSVNQLHTPPLSVTEDLPPHFAMSSNSQSSHEAAIKLLGRQTLNLDLLVSSNTEQDFIHTIKFQKCYLISSKCPPCGYFKIDVIEVSITCQTDHSINKLKYIGPLKL